MSPTNFHDYHHHNNNNHRHGRRESNITTTTTFTAAAAHYNSMLCPPPLKINRDSHFIRKPSTSMPMLASSTSSTSSSASSAVVSKPPQPRHPVIIYTHSPKVIHTDPKDFMALVQKLTGWSRSEENQAAAAAAAEEKERKKKISDIGGVNDDNDSTITEEYGLLGREASGGGQVNSSAPFMTEHPQPQPPPQQQPSHQNTYLPNFPMFARNSPEFMCTSQVPYYNFGDSMFLPPNIRTSSLPPPSFLDNVGDLHEFYDKC